MAYKTVITKSTIADAVSAAFGEFQSLRDEMRERADNMEEKFSATDLYQRVSECADALDGFADEEPEMPNDDVGALDVEVAESVNRRKGKGPSRAVRCGNACAALQAVIERCEGLTTDEVAMGEWLAKINGEHPIKDGAVSADDAEEVLDELIQSCQAALDEAEGLDFPGMYG